MKCTSESNEDKNEEEPPSPSPTQKASVPEPILKPEVTLTPNTESVSPRPSMSMPVPIAPVIDTPQGTTTSNNTTTINNTPAKPALTKESLQKKRENHKLVERRRRQTINKGIEELALAVPGRPKKRSAVILKALERIRELECIADEAKQEVIAIREENQLLLSDIANKNKRINDLLLLL